MAFPVPLTSTLSGATPRQLAYWRRPTASADALLIPSAQRSGRFLYSWADVIALRSIVYLRQEKSLPKIRRAVDALVRLEADEWDHLAEYSFVRTRTTILVKTRAGRVMDLEQQPGTMLEEVLMEDVLRPFETDEGRLVPALRQPKPRISIDPGVLGGYPVLMGTRVPYDVVASLAEDGYEEAEIIELYPSVRPGAVADAQAFAKDVAAAA